MENKFNLRFSITTRSFAVGECGNVKLSWRLPQGHFELVVDSKKIVLSHSQLNTLFEFFGFAKKKHAEFLQVGPWRSEVLKISGRLEGSMLKVLCEEDENTRQLHIMVTAEQPQEGCSSIMVSASEAERLLSFTGKIQRIKFDQDYEPGQGHPSVLAEPMGPPAGGGGTGQYGGGAQRRHMPIVCVDARRPATDDNSRSLTQHAAGGGAAGGIPMTPSRPASPVRRGEGASSSRSRSANGSSSSSNSKRPAADNAGLGKLENIAKLQLL